MNRWIRLIFVFIFLVGVFYIFAIQTRLYQSNSVTMVKNLNDSVPDLGGLGIFASAASSTLQDARLLQTYLSSRDELKRLDKKFHLNEHYHSDNLDFADRLYSFNSWEDFYQKYLTRLQLELDEVSGLLTIGFLHTDPNTSRMITEQLIDDSEEKINEYNHLVIKKRLSYLNEQLKKSKKELEESIKQLEEFQNTHNLLDPTLNAQTQSNIISNLQSSLVEKRSKLATMKKYMNENNIDVIRIKREIKEIEKTLKKIRANLAGKKKNSFNALLFEYERLKNFVELNQELYKAALLQYEQAKAEISQNPKVLMKLTQPALPDEYAFPKKGKSIFMLFLILLLGYGILALIHNIIKEH